MSAMVFVTSGKDRDVYTCMYFFVSDLDWMFFFRLSNGVCSGCVLTVAVSSTLCSQIFLLICFVKVITREHFCKVRMKRSGEKQVGRFNKLLQSLSPHPLFMRIYTEANSQGILHKSLFLTVSQHLWMYSVVTKQLQLTPGMWNIT